MQDDTESLPPPPPVSPFAFLRKPMFIFGVLFLAWIFFGQAATRFLPRAVERENPTATPVPASHEAPAKAPESIKEKDAEISELKHRLDDLEVKVKTLQDTATAPAKPADESAAMAKIATLQASLDTLQQAHSMQVGDATHITEALRKQEEDIANLKAQLADTQTHALRRLSLMSVFETLKDAAQRGESFADPLKAMNDLAKDDAPVQKLLAQLVPYAQDNAPTLPTLQSQFEATIPQALAPDNSGTLMNHLQSLIRIRKVGEQQMGTSNDAVIARAEAKLNRGDVAGGAHELAALSPPAAKAFAAWTDKAQAFIHIQTTLAALQPALLQEDKPAPVAASAPAEPAPKPAATQ